jgi:hypothetical protein
MYSYLAQDEVALTFFTFFLIRTNRRTNGLTDGLTEIAVYRGSALPKKGNPMVIKYTETTSYEFHYIYACSQYV